MFRTICSSVYRASVVSLKNVRVPIVYPNLAIRKNFSIISNGFIKPLSIFNPIKSSESVVPQNVPTQIIPSRTVTKFSIQKGKRKSVKCILRRFKRLDWGGWIRPRAGRHKKLWKKRITLRRRLKQHIFLNSTQSWLLDSMVTKFWKTPKYYVDDIYEPYQTREEYLITRKKPLISD